MIRAFVLFLALSTYTSLAAAQTDVVVVIAAPDSGLCSAVRVQLGADADVRCREPGQLEDVAASTLTVWIDTNAEGTLLLRTRDAEGATDAEVLGAAPELALERTVALKVREWWDRPHPRPVATPAPSVDLEPDPAPDPEPALPQWKGFAAFGAALTGPVGDTALVPSPRIHLGAQHLLPQWTVETGASLELTWLHEIREEQRSLDMRDQNIGLEASALRGWGKLSAGPLASVQLHLVHARAHAGTTVDELAKVLWAGRIGGQLRYMLGDSVGLNLHAGLELMKHRQRYAVAGEELLDFGRVRGVGGLTLRSEWP